MSIIDTTSSNQFIKSREEVNTFLNRAKACLSDASWHINTETWANGRINKTQTYLAEKNLKDDDVAEIIRELQIFNYCYTANDRNVNYSNETFWVFGTTKFIIDSEEKLYIKLKIRQFENEYLLVMSFHPEQPVDPGTELTFPYAM